MSSFRGEDLKHGAGDPDWLRLFALMSAEFSHVESCPVHEDMPERDERVGELRDLNERLKATSTLENINVATNYVENFIRGEGRYFLIRYGKDQTATVRSFDSFMVGASTLRGLEERIVVGEDDAKVVLVEADKIEKLTETYPNYFGDVSLFVRNLKSICVGRDAIEYSMVPQERVPVRRQEAGDPSRLRRRYSQWDDAITKAGKS